MSDKSERRAAREVVAAYHEARQIELVQRVGDAVDDFRAGEPDAFQADQVIFQCSRAAKVLWKFCNLPDVEFTASLIREQAPADPVIGAGSWGWATRVRGDHSGAGRAPSIAQAFKIRSAVWPLVRTSAGSVRQCAAASGSARPNV